MNLPKKSLCEIIQPADDQHQKFTYPVNIEDLIYATDCACTYDESIEG